jgi:hypothetical protein
MTTETQTLADVKKATAVKLSLTSKGYKATVKGSTPVEALALAQEAHLQMVVLRETGSNPENRKGFPILVVEHGTGEGAPTLYLLSHGGGDCVPFDPSQDLNEDYAVKIELEMNSKGIGWTVGVKAPSVDAGVAVIAYVEDALTKMFPGGGAA